MATAKVDEKEGSSEELLPHDFVAYDYDRENEKNVPSFRQGERTIFVSDKGELPQK